MKKRYLKKKDLEYLLNSKMPAQVINPLYHGGAILRSGCEKSGFFLIYQEGKFIGQRIVEEPNSESFGLAISYFELKSGHYLQVNHTTEPRMHAGITISEINVLYPEEMNQIISESKYSPLYKKSYFVEK